MVGGIKLPHQEKSYPGKEWETVERKKNLRRKSGQQDKTEVVKVTRFHWQLQVLETAQSHTISLLIWKPYPVLCTIPWAGVGKKHLERGKIFPRLPSEGAKL